MTDSERERLFCYNELCISIGISEDGERYNSYSVPWNSTANAYNMKLPDIYLSPDDLNDEQIMQKVCSFRVRGCYIFCELDDYTFLKRIPTVYDLNIFFAHNLRDISFFNELTDCRMLFLHKAHIKDLDVTLKMDNLCCLALFDCIIDDNTSICKSDKYFNEIIVSNPKDRSERERWRARRGVSYYEYVSPSKKKG